MSTAVEGGEKKLDSTPQSHFIFEDQNELRKMTHSRVAQGIFSAFCRRSSGREAATSTSCCYSSGSISSNCRSSGRASLERRCTSTVSTAMPSSTSSSSSRLERVPGRPVFSSFASMSTLSTYHSASRKKMTTLRTEKSICATSDRGFFSSSSSPSTSSSTSSTGAEEETADHHLDEASFHAAADDTLHDLVDALESWVDCEVEGDEADVEYSVRLFLIFRFFFFFIVILSLPLPLFSSPVRLHSRKTPRAGFAVGSPDPPARGREGDLRHQQAGPKPPAVAVVARRRPRAVRPGSFLFEQRSCFFVRFGSIPFQVDLSPRRARDERQAAGGARGSLWKGAEGTLEKEEDEERGDKKTVAKKTQLSFSLSCLLQSTPCPASRLPPRATAAAAPDAAAAVRASLKHQRRQRRWRRSRLPLLGGRGRSRQQQQRRRRRRQVPPDLLRRRRRSTLPPLPLPLPLPLRPPPRMSAA